jgi:D-alanyl-D-alanine carboxypeptidase (penicillin-binding protein 5/6)
MEMPFFGPRIGGRNRKRIGEIMKRIANGIAILAAACVLGGTAARADQIETVAKQAYIIDLTTHTVLLEKNADERMPPASMSKLMTIYVLFEQLKKRAVRMEDTFLVSENAWRKGGSKMFVKVGDRVSVHDLLRGIIVQSGNDACIVVAEGISGTEEAFADLLTKRGKEIGLTNSTFRNSTGWPDPDHRMTSHDLAILSQRLIEDFPEYYPIFKEIDFTYNGIKQGNRNPLLYQNLGADGLKTGHTENAGYGLTASAVRDGRRIVMVLNGMTSMKERSQESARLIDWAFRTFDAYTFFKKDEEITKADVWLGVEKEVPLLIPQELRLTLSRAARAGFAAKVKLKNPVAAPIAKGAQLGTLIVTAPGFKTLEIPLVAGADARQLGFMGRIGAAINHVLWGSS